MTYYELSKLSLIEKVDILKVIAYGFGVRVSKKTQLKTGHVTMIIKEKRRNDIVFDYITRAVNEVLWHHLDNPKLTKLELMKLKTR
tara:strand:- start:376 stop:633 length:258 start_codon:yes stop_codon:yes gene_type:complete